MTTVVPANVELALLLPLGVVAKQLMKAEADLRLLSMRTGVLAGGEGGTRAQLAGHLERIHETLESIRGLVADLEADMRRKPDPRRDD